MPGSTMIGGHLAMAAGLALANANRRHQQVSVAFFGDGTLGSGDLHETMHIAGAWELPLILVCENNGWEMSTPWSKVRKHALVDSLRRALRFGGAHSGRQRCHGCLSVGALGAGDGARRPTGVSRLHDVSHGPLQLAFRRSAPRHRKRI